MDDQEFYQKLILPKPELSDSDFKLFEAEQTHSNLIRERYIAIILVFVNIVYLFIIDILLKQFDENLYGYDKWVKLFTYLLSFGPPCFVLICTVRIPRKEEISFAHKLLDHLNIFVLVMGSVVHSIWVDMDTWMFETILLLASILLCQRLFFAGSYYLMGFLILIGGAYASELKQLDINILILSILTLVGICLLAVDVMNRSRQHRFLRDKLLLEQKQLLTQQHDELLEKNKILESLSTKDGLTGIANRRHFDAHLESEWKRSRRRKSHLGLLMMDVDFFKVFNDTYGHQAGDDCLIKIAKALDSTVNREGEVVARYGGEEFAAILPDHDPERTIAIAEKFRESVLALKIAHTGNETGIVSLSIGAISICHDQDLSIKEMLAGADKALYQAKENGRNQVKL